MHESNIKSTNNSQLVLLDIDDVLFDTSHFKSSQLTSFRLYEDVIDFLDHLTNKAEIGILSQGEEAFQLKKIIATGIFDRFHKDHIHIVEKKDASLTAILQKYVNNNSIIYFIDDRLNSLYHAKEAIPKLITIWLQRGRYIGKQELIAGFTPDHTVYSFKDVLPIIKI